MAGASAVRTTHVADSHEVIRVVGARENNLKNVTVEIPKRRLTVFTGVSGSGKSSLVFGTIAAESQRLINETYPTFVQQFMAAPDRPDGGKGRGQRAGPDRGVLRYEKRKVREAEYHGQTDRIYGNYAADQFRAAARGAHR